MKASQRREEIAQTALINGPTSIEELALRYGVTRSTIRRDLARLTEEGRVARTYGGAIPLHREPPLAEREAEGLEAKREIAAHAARQVTQNQTVLLDAGTTTAALARLLTGPLTVVTPGLSPLAALREDEGIEAICLGGHYRGLRQAFAGPLTEALLERFTFDIAFLGADAVHPVHGLCEATQEQVRLKELLARSAERVYVLAHGAKLGAKPFNAWARFDPRWILVTDTTASESQLAIFRERGIAVEVASSLA